jgi:uncharacterized membrane protein YdcZ (DUF606 family)
MSRSGLGKFGLNQNKERIMGAPKLVGIVLLVVGVVLLFFGWQSSQAVGDQVTEALTGRFTDTTMWYFILGAAAVAAGAFLTFVKKF